MANAQISDIRQALKTAFTNAGHTAYAYPPGDTNTANPKEYAYLDEAISPQEHLTFGGSRAERVNITGLVLVYKPGADDAVAKSAEDAALAIVGDLEDYLRTTPGLSDADVFHAQFGGVLSSEVRADDGNRIAVIRFEVDVETHI